METIENLEKKMQQLEAEIQETKKRLPAHSVKPPVMMDLLDLEDEYDRLMKRVRELKQAAVQRKCKKISIRSGEQNIP